MRTCCQLVRLPGVVGGLSNRSGDLFQLVEVASGLAACSCTPPAIFAAAAANSREEAFEASALAATSNKLDRSFSRAAFKALPIRLTSSLVLISIVSARSPSATCSRAATV